MRIHKVNRCLQLLTGPTGKGSFQLKNLKFFWDIIEQMLSCENHDSHIKTESKTPYLESKDLTNLCYNVENGIRYVWKLTISNG